MKMARLAAEAGDDGTNDLLVSNVIRSNELQAWFVAEHVVQMPLVQAVSLGPTDTCANPWQRHT